MKPNSALVPLQNELLSRIQLAANYRASGMSWEAVSQKVGRASRTCRAWQQLYPDLWTQFIRQAQAKVLTNLGIAASRILKRSLHSENEKTQLSSAKFLYSADLKMRLAEIKSQAKEPTSDDPTFDYIVEQIKGLSHEEAEQHLDRIVQERLALRDSTRSSGEDNPPGEGTIPSIDESQ